MDNQRNIQKEIDSLLEKFKVVLFMKGTPTNPACGFSSRAVSILKANGLNLEDYLAVNILDDEEMRNGIKVYSSWPTIPQLYIDKEFIGGSDIMTELHNSKEIRKLLNR